MRVGFERAILRVEEFCNWLLDKCDSGMLIPRELKMKKMVCLFVVFSSCMVLGACSKESKDCNMSECACDEVCGCSAKCACQCNL